LEYNIIFTVVIPSIIALGIALFVRYGIKPKIETVYEKNRNSTIRGLLIEANSVSKHFNDSHRIFEMQQGFVVGQHTTYGLTVRDFEKLKRINEIIKKAFKRIITRKDFLLFHLKYDELEAVLNYIANASSFYSTPFGTQPNQNGIITVIYDPLMIDVMRHHGWSLINMFPQIINYEFIQSMMRYERFRAI
jgi:hypothetical protein